MPQTARRCVALIAAGLVACGGGRSKKDASPSPSNQPLAVFAAQRLAVTPTGFVQPDSVGWVGQLGGVRSVARTLDSAIVAVLDERGLARRWILPAELARGYERNRTYATDPYQLAIQPLRAATFKTESRYGEPLSSQLRTMIALHEDARLVLLPIELRLEGQRTGVRGVLRAALVDPRMANARWVGDVTSDETASPSAAIGAVAARLADLFVAP